MFEMFIPTNKKMRTFSLSIIRSGLYLGAIVLLWFVDNAYSSKLMISLDKLLLFFLPYYTLWVVIVAVSIFHRGETFKIIWMVTFFDEETYSSANSPYAYSFLGGSLIILLIQLLGPF